MCIFFLMLQNVLLFTSFLIAHLLLHIWIAWRILQTFTTTNQLISWKYPWKMLTSRFFVHLHQLKNVKIKALLALSFLILSLKCISSEFNKHSPLTVSNNRNYNWNWISIERTSNDNWISARVFPKTSANRLSSSGNMTFLKIKSYESAVGPHTVERNFSSLFGYTQKKSMIIILLWIRDRVNQNYLGKHFRDSGPQTQQFVNESIEHTLVSTDQKSNFDVYTFWHYNFIRYICFVYISSTWINITFTVLISASLSPGNPPPMSINSTGCRNRFP